MAHASYELGEGLKIREFIYLCCYSFHAEDTSVVVETCARKNVKDAYYFHFCFYIAALVVLIQKTICTCNLDA